MPVELGVWRIGEKLQRVSMSPMKSEAKLEDLVASDLSVVSPNLMLLGRQVPTAFGKYLDLLTMDDEGNLTIVELKRDRTPREVVAQTLDYASWIQTLSFDEVSVIFSDKNGGKQLEEGFHETFGASLPEEINQRHELLIVASELDPSTERIIGYLRKTHGVPINAVFFHHFRDGDREYLARSWLIDPQDAEAMTTSAAGKKGQEPWNGRDFYVSFGEGPHRAWDDARRYGFVSGGQGKWYSQTLKLLFPGSRVFVNIPGTGYVGVGTVKEAVVPVRDFRVNIDGKEVPILNAPLDASKMGENADDLARSEYLVRVEWVCAVPKGEAYWETGLFAIQHTACRMRSRFTIERLTKHFGLDH
jgi:hypothetical protein